MKVRVAADVARAAASRADIVQRIFHRADYLGVLAHRKIVVRAPHRDRLGPVMAMETARIGKRALVTHDIDEDAIAPFLVQAINRLVEDLVVVHAQVPLLRTAFAAAIRAQDLGAKVSFCHP